MYRLLSIFFLSLGSLPLLLAQEGPRLVLSEDHSHLTIDQIPPTYWQQFNKSADNTLGLSLRIYDPQRTSTPPAMLGQYEQQGQQIVFRPVLPFQAGQSYVATLLDQFTFHFSIPKTYASEISQVLSVFPSGKTVPANLLKVYLHFSHPMSEGQAYRHITLVDQNGQKVERAFLELYPELWDIDRKRLTLWLEPGRIKRALGPNQNVGSPMVNGQSYRLVVDHQWIDAKGNPLAQDYEQQWQVAPAHYQRIDWQRWQYEWPSPNSTDPLKIRFERPIDQAVLMKSFVLTDAANNQIAGHFESSENESVLQFYPQNAWAPGKYCLRIAASLEDVAGNNLNRPFDLDLLDSSTKIGDQECYEQHFTIEKVK
ncbi:MAG: Ig-like domain-containing protein [Bacteroidota bacterium]